MELNKKINIRISDDQMKVLMSAVIDEKTTLSNLIRSIINGIDGKNFRSADKRANAKIKK